MHLSAVTECPHEGKQPTLGRPERGILAGSLTQRLENDPVGAVLPN